MHPEALEAVRRMVNTSGYINGPRAINNETDLPAKRCGLDLGGADVNGTARSVIPDVDVWYGLDIAPGPGVDLVADATDDERMRNYADLFDVVLCTELLEHVENWRAVLDNAWSVLAPRGTAFFTFAGTDGHTWARRPHGARGEHDVPKGEYYGNVPLSEFGDALDKLLCAAHPLPEIVTTKVPGGFEAVHDGGQRAEVWCRPVPGDIYCWFRK
jgi:SAM-dependent methyltransferase